MHKIFGVKDKESYITRIGAYIIPIKNNKIGVIKTSKSYFLIGGGKHNDETDEQCIKRECLEEIGCDITIHKKFAVQKCLLTTKKLVIFIPFKLTI